MTEGPAGSPGIEVLADAEALASRAATEVLRVLGSALEQRARASWVLAGGSTPRELYEILADRPRAIDWRRVELFWGDERCVEPTSVASNFRLVGETLLAGLPFSGDCVHRVRGELPPAEAAVEYARRVGRALDGGPFDLVLLGLGADGHVASLFPGAWPAAGELVAAVQAPVEPRWRVTMTPAALARSTSLLYLVRGRDKAAALARALDPARQIDLISDQVRPRAGETLWLVDREAAAQLPDRSSGPVVA